MKQLWIFNPDNDMALADGGANYMPPKVIRRMMEDLALLPAWMAQPGDAVLAASAYNDSFLREADSRFGMGVGLITPPELKEIGNSYEPMPWGWSPAICQRLRSKGMEESLLPDSEKLEQLRQASHRATAVNILSQLHINNYICGESRLLHTAEECRDFVDGNSERLLKAPLSGSGKGLNWCLGEITPSVEGWCRQTIERQGAVVGEPVYEKAIDFAMEFMANGTDAPEFVGYSLFTTSRSGSYEGNLLMSDEEIEDVLSEKVPLSALHEVRGALPALLKQQIGSYRGFVGVDMMICLIDLKPTFKIHPCVEVNLRSNMGVLSHYIYKVYIAPGHQGIFRLDYHSSPAKAMEFHSSMQQEHPLVVENGKVVSGYLPLNPVTKQTQYLAYLTLNP